ncbi:hypothetical protein ACFRCG_09865 [Embleya sp. NPDC056575]|uniref:hypothetical protein n=1 Tax=unclassified Embleya TaxID=2699296 RepID=UPI0036A8C2BE
MKAQELIASMRPDVERCIADNETVTRVRARDADRDLLRRLVIAEFNCQESELVTYGLLVARHHDETSLDLFSLTIRTVTEARKLLNEAARSVDLGPQDLTLAGEGRLGRAVSSLVAPGLLGTPGAVALYLHSDLVVWCALFDRIASAAREANNVPKPLIEYLESWGSEPSAEFVDNTVKVISHSLAHGEDPARMLASSRQLESIVSDYWGFVNHGG